MNEELLEKLHKEGLKVASFNRRSWAYSIDEILIYVLMIIIHYKTFVALESDIIALVSFFSSLFIQYTTLKVIYHTFFIWYYGATPGKMLARIECLDVVMLSKPSFKASLIRSIVRLISEWFFYIGFLWAFSSPARLTWHDRLAETVVCDDH